MTDHHRPAVQSTLRAGGRRPAPARGNASGEGGQDIDLDRLNGHVGYLVRRAQIWIFQDFIRTLAAVDIRPAQYSVLIVIDANRGLTQTSLSQALGIERARLVRLLDALEARRLVQRRPSAGDRRSHALSLTAEGRAALTRIKALAQQHEGRLAQRVGRKNHKTLLRLLSVFASG